MSLKLTYKNGDDHQDQIRLRQRLKEKKVNIDILLNGITYVIHRKQKGTKAKQTFKFCKYVFCTSLYKRAENYIIHFYTLFTFNLQSTFGKLSVREHTVIDIFLLYIKDNNVFSILF